MKIILACRNGPSSYYIAACLAQRNLLHAIIIEDGKTARRNKIGRMFRRSTFWQIPATFLNIAILFVYQAVQDRAIRIFVARQGVEARFPDGVQQLRVDDINSTACEEFLANQEPGYLVVMGTALLQDRIINIPSIATLNIHGGMVPKYRNVHCDLWAYIDNDHENIGTSIIYLDAGIDTGDIVCQASANVCARDGLLAAKTKNLLVAGNLIEKALTEKELINDRTAQDKELQRFFPTPGNAAFMRLLSITIRRTFGW